MNFVDLFSGIGGFTLGLKQAGHNPVGWCEIDKYAQKSYRAIHQPKEEWFSNDIRAVDPHRMPDFEILTFGWPCQDNSIAGKRAGQKEGTRSGLLYEATRILRVKKPKYFIAENVPGLFSVTDGKDFYQTIQEFTNSGYDVQWQVLNTRWFLPQNRERVFFVGHLREIPRPQVFPIERAYREATQQNGVKQLIGGSQGSRVYDPSGISITLSSEGGGLGAKTGLYLINKREGQIKLRGDVANCIDANYYKGLDAHQARTGVLHVSAALTPDRLEKRQNGRRIKNSGEPMFTLTAQDVHGVFDGVQIRKLTPRECFRLQGFPDWAFDNARAAGISDSQLYKQAGNSVSVPVIYEIAKRLT